MTNENPKVSENSMRALYSKKDILLEIGLEMAKEKAKLEQSELPKRYHEARLALFDRLLAKVKDMRFLGINPGHNWYYVVYADVYGAKVELIYGTADENVYRVQRVVFAEVKAKLISAEDYGTAYNYPGDTIRRWIRRGKLPSAIKQGRSWSISELALPKGRGYEFRTYEWDRAECNFEDEMAFLNAYDGISLEQLKDGDFFIIPRIRDHCGLFIDVLPLAVKPDQEGKRLNQREKEHFELKLIENPFVRVLTAKLETE